MRQCTRASASERRTNASSWRTVILYAAWLPGCESPWRRRTYASTTSFCASGVSLGRIVRA